MMAVWQAKAGQRYSVSSSSDTSRASARFINQPSTGDGRLADAVDEHCRIDRAAIDLETQRQVVGLRSHPS